MSTEDRQFQQPQPDSREFGSQPFYTQQFYTMNGYRQKAPGGLTPAMEDYLEMICRLCITQPTVRLHDLAAKLHVKPSSASRMIGQLKKAGLIQAERYGHISLTPSGRAAGDYLLYRHSVVLRFLARLNNCDNMDDMLEQTEKIEHFLSPETVTNLARLLDDDRESK